MKLLFDQNISYRIPLNILFFINELEQACLEIY
jgi:hypothetical protein